MSASDSRRAARQSGMVAIAMLMTVLMTRDSHRVNACYNRVTLCDVCDVCDVVQQSAPNPHRWQSLPIEQEAAVPGSGSATSELQQGWELRLLYTVGVAMAIAREPQTIDDTKGTRERRHG